MNYDRPTNHIHLTDREARLLERDARIPEADFMKLFFQIHVERGLVQVGLETLERDLGTPETIAAQQDRLAAYNTMALQIRDIAREIDPVFLELES